MVSYTSVHMTPAKYKGKHTDHSHDPLMADQPRRAPQLNVSPKNIGRIKKKKVRRMPAAIKYYLFEGVLYQQLSV